MDTYRPTAYQPLLGLVPSRPQADSYWHAVIRVTIYNFSTLFNLATCLYSMWCIRPTLFSFFSLFGKIKGERDRLRIWGGRFVRQRDSASIRGQPEGEMFTSILYKKKKKKKSVFLLLHGVGNISIYFGADAVGARIGRRGSQGQLLGAPTPSTRASPPPLGILAVCHSPYYRLEMRAAPQIGRQQI